jgi:hypothetical protein
VVPEMVSDLFSSMSSTMKFDLPLLDYKTRFSLRQVKMRAILANTHDLDEVLDKFGGKSSKD